MTESLTVQEAIADSLIALVNAADGIDQRSFAEFLVSEARRQSTRSEPHARLSSKVCNAQLQFALHPPRRPASNLAGTDAVYIPAM
ncbi:hypothetical protein ASG19_07590 [Rhizobium sp. Leaf306]|nr:hypothetical protein ASG19_07590 [Rhizobium sp. Leaf306]